MIIKKVKARKILNSLNKPTVEVTINKKFVASAPSGTSKGKKEVVEFPKNIDYCIEFLNKLKLKNIKIEEFDDLVEIEKYLEEIKGNTLIAFEFAILKAISDNEIWKFLNPHVDKLPIPLGNCIGGGVHYRGSSIDFQELLLIPRSNSFFDNALANLYVYNLLGRKLKFKKKTYENAWVSNFNTEKTLIALESIVKEVSNNLGFKIDLGIDVAANNLWKKEKYNYKDKGLTKEEQLKFMIELIKDYNLRYLEDPFEENDIESFNKLKKRTNCLICGDDLVCTNLKILEKVKEAINAVIIKPNQIGSLIECKKVVDFAKRNDIICVMSHRSGETMDNTIAHLAVAWEIPYIKVGIVGKERKAKINELIRIEKEIRSI